MHSDCCFICTIRAWFDLIKKTWHLEVLRLTVRNISVCFIYRPAVRGCSRDHENLFLWGTSNGFAASHWGQTWLRSGPSPARLPLSPKPLPVWTVFGEPLPSPQGPYWMTSLSQLHIFCSSLIKNKMYNTYLRSNKVVLKDNTEVYFSLFEVFVYLQESQASSSLPPSSVFSDRHISWRSSSENRDSGQECKAWPFLSWRTERLSGNQPTAGTKT